MQRCLWTGPLGPEPGSESGNSARLAVFLLTAACLCGPATLASADSPGLVEDDVTVEAADEPVSYERETLDASTANLQMASDGVMPMSLADAVALGLENNLEVEINRHAPLIAEQSYLSSWGSYDPFLAGEFGHEKATNPSGSPFQTSNATKGTDGSISLSGMIPYLGTLYSIDYGGNRSDDDSIVQTYNPQFGSSMSFYGSMPLLKGLIWNRAWTEVRAREVIFESTTEEFLSSVMTTVEGIEIAYWNLIAVRDQLRVARKSQDTSNALLKQVETQYEVGVVSKVDVIEAEAGVADRDFQVILQENFFRTAQDVLINAVLGPHLTASSTLEIDPTEAPETYTPYEVDVDASLDRAFANRPELRAAEKEVERNEIELRFAKNARLPQLDFQASYRVNALAGRNGTDFTGAPLPNPTAAAGGTYGDASDSLFSGLDGEGWTVRGLVSIPLGNISGRHDVTRAEFELRRATAILLRTQNDIVLEIRGAARDLLSSDRGIEAAERRRVSAEEQLRAERVRLEHGESTPFDVLQREEDLVEAESQKINALQAYRNSEARLLRAQGTILGARQVRIEDAAPMR